MSSPKTVYVLYEAGQVEALEKYLAQAPGLVVPLSPLIEEVLEGRGIAYVSGRAHHPSNQQRFLDADAWVSAWVTSPQWQWFAYRSVALADLFSFPVQLYLVSLLYYTHILESIIQIHAPQRLVVFPAAGAEAPARRPLEQKQARAMVACARLVGALCNTEVEVPEGPKAHTRARQRRAVGALLKRLGIACGIHIHNSIMGMRPRTLPRILVSDYWRNIEPLALALPQGELVLFDRSEIIHAPWRELWRLRVRLFNFDSFPSTAQKGEHTQVMQTFLGHWQALRAHVPQCGEAPILAPLLEQMLEELVGEEALRMLPQIDSAWRMLEKLRPSVVLLRVSVTSQPHFHILASVAGACDIPSLELQHGLEYLGPGSISKRHSAQYVAVYGPIIQDAFASLGFPREKFPVVGSPRFDAYSASAPLPCAPHPFTVLCVGYGVGMEWFYDDYETEEYYAALARAVQSMPNVSVIVKLRPGAFREADCRALVGRAFGAVPYTLVQHEQFPELFARADVVYSYYSTVILEALQFGKPVIAYSAQEMERTQIATHFTPYANQEALMLADTPKALEAALSTLQNPKAQKDMSTKARAAMKEFHRFDGSASKRILALIQALANKERH